MRIRFVLLAIIAFMLAIPALVGAEMTGRQVLEEQKQRLKVKSERAEEIMLLVDRKDNKEKRLITREALELEPDVTRALLVFQQPADVRGTALLTWGQPDRADDQWLYLPAQKKMQRIATGSKKSYFMGTDFTYEDMQPEKVDDFGYDIVRDENDPVEGAAQCWVIEAVPANDTKRKESGYSKRVMWVRQDNYVTVKIEFYDPRGRLLKTQTAHDIEHLGGTVYRARKTLMDNHKEKHKTVMGTKTRQVDVDIDETVFTERHIMSGKHVQ